MTDHQYFNIMFAIFVCATLNAILMALRVMWSYIEKKIEEVKIENTKHKTQNTMTTQEAQILASKLTDQIVAQCNIGPTFLQHKCSELILAGIAPTSIQIAMVNVKNAVAMLASALKEAK